TLKGNKESLEDKLDPSALVELTKARALGKQLGYDKMIDPNALDAEGNLVNYENYLAASIRKRYGLNPALPTPVTVDGYYRRRKNLGGWITDTKDSRPMPIEPKSPISASDA